MSYDLAVWEGDAPASNAVALDRYKDLMEQLESGTVQPPSGPIQDYVAGLLGQWPDITDDAGEDSPWADGPMLNNAFGAAIYFSMVWSRAEEASDFAATLATQQGLVCFDPQSESVRSTVAPAQARKKRLFGRRDRS